jgi:hypothetical protein
MADILCKQCNAYISDPCVMISGLFLKKMNLEAKPKRADDKIDTINKILQEKLGLDNHQQLFERFKRHYRKSKVAKVNQPILFTLTCINGHTNQYSITCP